MKCLVEKGDVMWTTVLNRIPTLPPYLQDGAADRDEPLYKAVRVDGGAILPNIGTHVPRPHSAADAIPALTEPQCLMQEPNFFGDQVNGSDFCASRFKAKLQGGVSPNAILISTSYEANRADDSMELDKSVNRYKQLKCKNGTI